MLVLTALAAAPAAWRYGYELPARGGGLAGSSPWPPPGGYRDRTGGDRHDRAEYEKQHGSWPVTGIPVGP
jgi:hypothetical protein